MAARLRLATAIVLGIAAVVVIALAFYLLTNRDETATAAEMRSWSSVHRALFVLAHNRFPFLIGGVLVGGGLVALGLAAVLVRTRLRWPLLLIAGASLALIYVAQWAKDDIIRSEPRGYREKSTYVQAARWLATSTTVYLIVVALLALAAWWLSRPPRATAAPAASPSPSP